MRRRFVSAAALFCGLFLVGAVASASTVSFTTAFEITSGVGTGTNTAHLGAATFQLLGLTDTVTMPQASTPFGSLTYARNGEVGPLSGTFGFKLTVTQLAPAGVGISFGQFVGSMNFAAGLANLSFISGVPIQIGNVRYTPQDVATFFAGSGGTSELRGAITAVPPPSAFLGGAGLCGVIVAMKFARRMALEI